MQFSEDKRYHEMMTINFALPTSTFHVKLRYFQLTSESHLIAAVSVKALTVSLYALGTKSTDTLWYRS